VLAELTMPFEYRVLEAGVQVAAADGSWLHLVFGPWGAHNSPHTGHAYGNGKADMMAVFNREAADLSAFDGGPCVDYDDNAPNCGLPRATVLARRPVYILSNGFSAETLASMEEHRLAYEIRRVMVTYPPVRMSLPLQLISKQLRAEPPPSSLRVEREGDAVRIVPPGG
jgi:hypothetical protein